jgi:F-type H+-transporting ATPase subunit delta
MSVETIARRYASALADVIGNNPSSVVGELKAWEEMFKGDSDLMSAFKNPAIAHLNKERVLESLIQKSGPSATTANFLRVLLQNGRITHIAEINETLGKVLEERAGKMSASVVSARELTDAEKTELQKELEKKTGKDLSLTFGIDQGLIGGLVTTIGSTVYDSSVRTQLNNLRQELVNG